MKWRRWLIPLSLLPLSLAAIAWALLPSDLGVTTKGPLREVLLVLGVLLFLAISVPAALWLRRQNKDEERLAAVTDREQRLLENLDHQLRNPLTAMRLLHGSRTEYN